MVVRVIAIFALFEQPAELDGLVGLVVVHGAQVKPHRPEEHPGQNGRRKDDRKAGDEETSHFTGMP